jgi:hypothetical protein
VDDEPKHNEVTLTVKLSDRDYDDLERWAQAMKMPGGIGEILGSVLMPAEQVRKFIADCRDAEKKAWAQSGMGSPVSRVLDGRRRR